MAKLTIKGHEFNAIAARDSFNRRTLQFSNKIVDTLKRIGLTVDDIDIPLESVAIKKAPASATWYFQGYRLHYSYNGTNRFVDNLYVVFMVISLEVDDLIKEQKTTDEFIHEFAEDDDVSDQRKKARELLGVEEDTIDISLINKRYKILAKECHPDMPNGDTEKFKALNRTHKILLRELK
ncbi:MAG TPA: J domain-containing protein [Candidatus Nanoarchaeia archaeon]|nr:J domain-containing protein [Candidatus Nanoarchaeia archaeon]